MSAAPQLAPGSEAEQPPIPVQEAPKPASVNEALTGAPAPESPETLREAEARSEREGMAKVNEMGKNLNLQAEAGAQEFKQETKSWWQRTKDKFRKTEGAAPKGEAEILQEIEKADTVYAEFKKAYDETMASGDQAGLRGLESGLSQAYDQLAAQVAKEGADESKQWKKALKTGEEPPMTVAGAKLNDVTRRLAEVRGRLNGTPPAPKEAPPQPAPEAAPQAAPAPETAPVAPAVSEQDRSELEKASAGKPGEKMVEEYLKVRDIKADAYGPIAARAFDPDKGEIRLTYEDGSVLHRYASGLELRVHPGGEGVKPWAEVLKHPGAEPEKPPQAAPQQADQSVDIDVSDLAEAPIEGVVSGETESKPESSGPGQEESVIVSPEAHLSPALEKVTKELDEFDVDKAKEDLLLNFRIGPEVGKSTVDRWKRKRVDATNEADFKKMLSEEYEIPLDEIDAIPASDLAAQHERMLSALDRLIETGDAELRKLAPPAVVKTSEQALTASGEIDTEKPTEEKPAEQKPLSPREVYPDLPTPQDGSRPPGVPEPSPAEVPSISVEPGPDIEVSPAEPKPVAETAPTTVEKKEAGFDKLEAKMDDAAAEIIKMMPEEAQSPNTFRSKVGKLPAKRFLEAFQAAGAISETEAKELTEEFKVRAEEFNELRKKFAQAAHKKLKG